MNITSNYFMINQENPEKEEEDSRILNNITHRKKSSQKFQIEKYQKFKPKPKIEIEKIDTTILTAENKVKLLLSSFLRDLKTEQKKVKYINNNINSQLKRKKTRIKKKVTINNKKDSSNIIIIENPSPNIKKINTISGNKYYNNENVNNSNRSISPSSKKRRNSVNSKSLFENSYNSLKDNISNSKKKYQNNFDSSINNILINSNIEKSGEINIKNSNDFHFHQNEVTLMSDIEKEHNKFKINSGKKSKKYKRSKTKNTKKTFNLVIKNNLYSKFELNNIINEKLLKLTVDIRDRMAIEKMLKESKNISYLTNINNSNFYYNCYNNTKNSNLSDKSKSEISSPKKELNFNDTNKTENINDSQLKSATSSVKGSVNEHTQKNNSYFSSKVSANSKTTKKFVKINTFKNLKIQIKNSIILRPDELNLSNVSDFNKNQSKFIFGDKEKTQRSKINNSSDNKNSETNISNNNLNIDKKLNKNKYDNEDEIINNKINKNSEKFLNNENENQIQVKKTFCSLGRAKTKLELMKENFRVLTYKKLIYDSFDDEEIEEEYYNNKYIHPDSLFLKIFDDIISFLTLSTLIYIPYYLASRETFCKNYNKSEYVYIILIEIFYLLDFIFGFFTAYYNFEEQLITNNIAIIKKYFVSWFLLDLISALPLHSYLKLKEPLCPNHNNIFPYDEKVYNIHYLIILNKLLKICKVNFINHNFIQITNKLGVKGIVIIQLLILFSGLHFFSCLHIFIGRNSYPNWIIDSEIKNTKFLDLYISSLYSVLACMTTVGYGDIVCHSFPERIFQIFLLILGGMAYSWFLSSFSSYIQKNNEKSVDFENRKQILDEIKLNYPKMSDILYEKTLQYLKYKNCNDKRDKNMIFDCLPIGLKNNLVYEMYKPIIKNFIFFKNFGNTDFIVRVILAFKPILAYKNDILLNEGDLVDSILFVKKGVLSVQVPINIKNPEEYIDKYLYGDILEQKNQKNSFLNSGSQNNNERKSSHFLNSYILQQGSNKISFLNLTEKEDLYNKMKKKEEENERKKNTRYIKIISIRENEHFGDVLMFIDKRSPLRVKVTSKKSELFLLKKMDVVEISSNYQNIWKRINKRSVYNYEQIKKAIQKMVELYCKFKGFNINKVDCKITNKSSKKIVNKRTMLPSSKLKMKVSAIKTPRRSLSQTYNKRKIYTFKYFNCEDDFSYEYKSIKTHVLMNLHKNILNNSNNGADLDESSKNSNINDNADNSNSLLNKKLNNIYNRRYKYYVNSEENKENYKTIDSMIKEEPENDLSKSSIKLLEVTKNQTTSNDIKRNLVKSNFYKKRTLSKKILDNKNQNENNLKEKRLSMKIINENDEIFHNRSKSIQPDSESIIKRKSSKDSDLIEDENQNNNNSLITNSINDEFNINEEIKIPINETLMNRCISESILLDKKNLISIEKINEIDKHNSEKILYSEKSLNKDSNSLGSILNKNNNKINNNKLNNSKKFFANENLIPDSIITDMQITSIYNNLHSINNKYYLNNDLQQAVKQLLEKEIKINTNNNIRKNSKLIGLNKYVNKSLHQSLNNVLSSNNKITNSSLNIYLKSSQLLPLTSSKKKFKQRIESLDEKDEKHSSNNSKSEDKNENLNSSKIVKKKRNNFSTNIGDSSPTKAKLKKHDSALNVSSKRQNHNIYRQSSTRNGFGIRGDLTPLNKSKNTMLLNPCFFNKKRKSSLLSTINFNIEKNSQNINNPNAFYSLYFQSLLENENKNREGLKTNSGDFYPQNKKNKK